jgi:hypothetical protein
MSLLSVEEKKLHVLQASVNSLTDQVATYSRRRKILQSSLSSIEACSSAVASSNSSMEQYLKDVYTILVPVLQRLERQWNVSESTDPADNKLMGVGPTGPDEVEEYLKQLSSRLRNQITDQSEKPAVTGSESPSLMDMDTVS